MLFDRIKKKVWVADMDTIADTPGFDVSVKNQFGSGSKNPL